MKKAQVQDRLLSCNPYDQSFFSTDQTQLVRESKPKYQKHQKIISFLKTKSFISTKVTISSSIEDRDLYDVIENAAYEELGLDITLEYKIDYFEQDHHDSNHRVFEVFIAEPEI
ncbi:MAG: hypothetical protein OEW60_07110, partial [Thiovulaceae bacterium]|nr:hypothetical protein [Sulfurimonadaceae bacterium]